MAAIDEDIKELSERALTYGASRATTISASMVVMDPRVRLKCQVPRCLHYGRNLMCPPHCISPEDFARSLERYSSGLLVQMRIFEDPTVMEKRRSEGLTALVNDESYLRQMKDSTRAFEKVLTRLEKDALMMGHRFSVALSGGTCALCDECVALTPGLACRHPFEARPSMEAVGIDVLATAANAGLPIEFPAKDPVWTGLLLIE